MLSSDHLGAALGTGYVVTRLTYLMGNRVAARWAFALPTGTRPRTGAALASPATAHACSSARPRTLSCRPCTISSRHLLHLLPNISARQNLFFCRPKLTTVGPNDALDPAHRGLGPGCSPLAHVPPGQGLYRFRPDGCSYRRSWGRSSERRDHQGHGPPETDVHNRDI